MVTAPVTAPAITKASATRRAHSAASKPSLRALTGVIRGRARPGARLFIGALSPDCSRRSTCAAAAGWIRGRRARGRTRGGRVLSPAERQALEEIEAHVFASDPELARLLTEGRTANGTSKPEKRKGTWPLLLWLLLVEAVGAHPRGLPRSGPRRSPARRSRGQPAGTRRRSTSRSGSPPSRSERSFRPCLRSLPVVATCVASCSILRSRRLASSPCGSARWQCAHRSWYAWKPSIRGATPRSRPSPVPASSGRPSRGRNS